MTTNAQHTPGPYVWRKHSNGELFCLEGAGGKSVIYPCSDVGEYGLSSREYVEVEPADAALIESSYDLLLAVIQYRNDLKFPPKTDSIERRIEMLDALIRKAGVS